MDPSKRPSAEEAAGYQMRRADFLRRSAIAGAAATGAGALLVGEATASKGKGASLKPSPDDSLRLWINRFSHIVVNVSDLERARAFWEKNSPLRVFAHTESPLQSFSNIGIKRGQFEGYLLRDVSDAGAITPAMNSSNPNFLAIHLVEWKTPKPVGVPYDRVNHIGWYRLAFRAERPIQQVYDDFIAAGETPFTPPAPDFPAIGLPDPDGIVLEYISRGPDGAPAFSDRISHFASSVRDPNATIRFYRDLVGIDHSASISAGSGTNTLDAYGGAAGYDVAFFTTRGDPRLFLDRLAWNAGATSVGSAYKEGNHIGYSRLSIEVDDIDAAYRMLVKQARRFKGVRVSAPPEEWDFGPEFGGKREVVTFTDPDGVGHELISQIPYGTALPLPRPIP